ncbi:MAG: LmbE family protein [Parcubacteria group bacterium GW2011_GWC2_45_7]|nr:MAG: LmbE family protein [Parcubacteria group bacterium GW2011_GWC2_45_7]
MVQEGAEVTCCLLGEGPLSRYTDREAGHSQEDVSGVKVFTENAARILGIARTVTFQFPDNQFDTVSLLEIVRAVEKVKEEVKPTVVFTHSRADLNIDHRATYQAVLTACRPVEGESVREIYSWDNPSSTEWNYPNVFQPNMFVNGTETLEKKIEALKCSQEALLAIATRWGSLAGMRCAEAFEVIRLVVL